MKCPECNGVVWTNIPGDGRVVNVCSQCLWSGTIQEACYKVMEFTATTRIRKGDLVSLDMVKGTATPTSVEDQLLSLARSIPRNKPEWEDEE